MAHPQLAPSSVRASRLMMVVVPVLLLATLAGCGHRKRTVLRPSYGSPTILAAPSSPGCVSPGCSAPATIAPGGGGGPTGTITTEPDSSEPILSPASAANSAPSDDSVIRSRGITPPVPSDANEPPLNLPTAPSTGGVELSKPNASTGNIGRRTGAVRRAPRVALRDGVVPFVADPNDLFQPPKADRPWKYVVVHHSANAKGGYEQIDRDHRKVLGFEGCGYHFVIGNGTDSPDGQIEVAQRWMDQKQGVHCRNGRTPDVNEYGIGICLVGNLDKAPPTAKQVAAARALVAYLGDRYAIASDHVGTHAEFADGPTACPGEYFPSDAIFGPKHVAIR